MGNESPEVDVTSNPVEGETREEVEARHKKELKALDGAKRAALKKAKATAGKSKKGKETLSAIEDDYAAKERALEAIHAQQLATFEPRNEDQPKDETPDDDQPPKSNEAEEAVENGTEKAEKKRQKNLLKKQKAREAEKRRELEIKEELANAGPSARDVESDRLKKIYLDPNKLCIVEVPADGHCLFRSIAAQCDHGIDYRYIRGICADTLSTHADEFAPFAEFEDSYEAYVDRVRSSADWGGQLELRALSQALRRSIIVYSASAPPLTMGGEIETEGEPIRVSYHKHYYALGEHYNSVVPKDTL